MLKDQRGVVHLLVLLILLAAIAAGVYLVGQRTNFLPEAGGGAIFFRDKNGGPLSVGEDGIPVSSSLEVQVELNAP